MVHSQNVTHLGVISSLSQNVETALKHSGQVYCGTSDFFLNNMSVAKVQME